MSDQTPITRFAPSPTGHLHIGGARTALFCWAYARGHEGRFLLRIEDTDQARSSESAARGILEDLAWLGIAWDDGPEFDFPDGSRCGGNERRVGPFFQSQRKEIYDAYFNQLIESGCAYPAFDTPEQLAEQRKACEAQKRTFIYRQPADYDHDRALKRAQNERHVLRLKMPNESVTVNDQVLGQVTFAHDELDDFVIRKADGFPTYHFAVVVDDALMGVTHVLRGQEHLNNTPRHIALQKALGFESPIYAHMPLIFNPDGTKMSKRDKDKAAKKAIRDAGLKSVADLRNLSSTKDHSELENLSDEEFTRWLKDKRRQLSRDQLAAVASALDLQLPEIDVEDFRAAGYLPEVTCNYLALLGWNPGLKNEDGTDLERFNTGFLAKHFDLNRIGKTQSKFDRDKLLAFNADTIQHGLSDSEFADRWLEWARQFDPALFEWAKADADRWLVAAAAARPRAKTLRDAQRSIRFAFVDGHTIEYDDKAVKKFMRKGEPTGIEVLQQLEPVVSAIEPWLPDAIDTALAEFAQAKGLGMGKVAQPLRIAITGAGVSPGLGHTLGLLSRGSVLERMERAVEALG